MRYRILIRVLQLWDDYEPLRCSVVPQWRQLAATTGSTEACRYDSLIANCKSRILIFAMIVFLSFLWMSESAYPAGGTSRRRRGADIALHKEVTISNPTVTIGIIADIQSEDKPFSQQLSKIEIERAPVVGYTRIFTVNDIKFRLRQHKIDLSEITFVGHEHVAVSTKGIEITPEQLLNFASKYIQEHLLADKAGVGEVSATSLYDRTSIELAAKPIKLTIPDGEVSFRVPAKANIRLSQHTSIPIQVILDGKTYRTLILSLKIKLLKKVIVAAKAIPKDKHLSEADICMEERNIIPVLGSALVDKSDTYGKRAKRRIQQGAILTDELIETPPLIFRGDRVTILVESSHLKVATVGIAKEDGYEGKIIRVQNISSKKIITAKVINEKLVRVEL